MIKIHHNPRCKKSREGLEYLKSKDVDFEVHNYFKMPFTEPELKNLLMKLNWKPLELIRTQEEVFRKQYKGRKFKDEEWIKIMVENPRLIQRPIVEKTYKAILAQPPDKIDELL